MTGSPSPLNPPAPPTATRLNRRALALAVAVAAVLALIVGLSLHQKSVPAAAPVEEARLEPSAPAFLERAPRPAITTPEEYFDDLHARQQAELALPQDLQLSEADLAALSLPPAPAPAPSAAPAPDPARDAFQRALRAPLSPSGAPRTDSGRAAAAPLLPGLTGPLPTALSGGLPAGLPAVPDLATLRADLEAKPPAPAPEPDRFARFLSSSRAVDSLGLSTGPAGSPFLLRAGTVVPATLLTAVDSGLPGQLAAVVTLDVYDSATQSLLLIPRGSRLLGRYDHQIAVGQDRLLVGWERLVLPDGRAFSFPALPAVDSAGRSGLAGRVDNHLLRVFGSALLLSVVSAGAQLSQPQDSAEFGRAPSTRQVAAGALGQELSSVAIEILRRSANVNPTIRVPAGTGFSVLLAGDLTFDRPAGAASR